MDENARAEEANATALRWNAAEGMPSRVLVGKMAGLREASSERSVCNAAMAPRDGWPPPYKAEEATRQRQRCATRGVACERSNGGALNSKSGPKDWKESPRRA